MGGWYAPSYTVTSKVTRLVHSVKFEVNIMGWTIFVLNRFHHRTHSIVIKDLLSSSKTCGTIGHCCAGDWMVGCEEAVWPRFCRYEVEDVAWVWIFFGYTREATKVAGQSIGVTVIVKLLCLTVRQMIGQLLFASNASSGLLWGDWQCSGGGKAKTTGTPPASAYNFFL